MDGTAASADRSAAPAPVTPRSPAGIGATGGAEGSPVHPSSSGQPEGERLPFIYVARAFERMRTTLSREVRLRLLDQLWRRYGRESQPMFPLMRLMLPHFDKRKNYDMKEKLLAQLYISMLGLMGDSADARELIEYRKPSSTGGHESTGGDFPDRAYSVLNARCPSSTELAQRRLSIADVNNLLDKLANTSSREEKQTVLRTLHRSTTALEQKWLLRIILKNMGLGIKENAIFKRYHPDAQDRWNSRADLEDLCVACHDAASRLDAVTIELFTPFNPKACFREEGWHKLHSVMSKQGDYSVEPKFDGDRLLLHFRREALATASNSATVPRGGVRGARVEWWSRNRKNYTSTYRDSMGPVLERCILPSVTECIVDGEMMGVDLATGRYLPFGEKRPLNGNSSERAPGRSAGSGGSCTHTRGGSRSADGADSCGSESDDESCGVRDVYMVFDLLWLNGRCLATVPLGKRRELIKETLRFEKHALEMVPHKIIRRDVEKGTELVMKELDLMMEAGYEGCVFKALSSPYEVQCAPHPARMAIRVVPGRRGAFFRNTQLFMDKHSLRLRPFRNLTPQQPGSRDRCWVKLKPDYVQGMGDTLDLLILAGYFGNGRRRGGKISSFLVGVKAPAGATVAMGGPVPSGLPLFYPLVKVGSGYSMKQLEDLISRLPEGKRFDMSRPPHHLCKWQPIKTDDRPDVWYNPCESVVVSVKAYEIISPCPSFRPCNHTLRFPRVEAIRRDKDWNHCDTFERVQKIYRDNSGRLAASKRNAAELAAEVGGAGGLSSRAKRQRPAVGGVPAHLRLAEGLEMVQKESVALEGVVAVIMGAGATTAAPAEGASKSVDELERLVKRLGGQVYKNVVPQKTTHIIDADERMGDKVAREVARLREEEVKLREAGSSTAGLQIVTASWLLACDHARARVPLEPKFVRYVTEEAREAMSALMDEWGDRYSEPTDAASMRDAMLLVRERRQIEHGANDVKPGRAGDAVSSSQADETAVLSSFLRLDDETAARLRTKYSLLRGARVFSPRENTALRLRLRLYGALVCDTLDGQVTHVALPSFSDYGARQETREVMTKAMVAQLEADDGPPLFHKHLVSPRWLDESIKRGERVDEEPDFQWFDDACPKKDKE